MPSALRQAIESFAKYYNHRRYHEALEYVTPADVYFAKRKGAKQRMLQVRKEHGRKLSGLDRENPTS